MSARYRVEVTDLAEGHVVQAALWWRTHRPKSPGAVREEFSRAIQVLAEQPHLGARARSERVPDARRLYLRRIRYYTSTTGSATTRASSKSWRFGTRAGAPNPRRPKRPFEFQIGGGEMLCLRSRCTSPERGRE